MNEGSIVAIAIASVGVAGQVVNYFLHLRIRAAILESERDVLDKVRLEYVLKELCVLYSPRAKTHKAT
jgi:hypothetical protein